MIAGLELPRSGSVRLAGRDLAGVPPHERGVGLMFQDYALFPHRDVGQNIGFGLRMQGEGGAAVRRRVAELLELVGLSGAERRPVSQLSGGEQQRVALARALAPRPRLSMLDEPMGSLDRALRERLPDELRGSSVSWDLRSIYVTHDQDEALSVADRVVLLRAGRTLADGTPEELWTQPPNEWTARFLGFRNITPGLLDQHVLHTPWGDLPAEVVDRAQHATAASGTGEEVLVVLRPAGLVADPAGPIAGHVSARRFRGDHVLLVVDVPDAPRLHVEAREGELLAPGGAHPTEGAAGQRARHPRRDSATLRRMTDIRSPTPPRRRACFGVSSPIDAGTVRELAAERGQGGRVPRSEGLPSGCTTEVA